MNFTRGYSWLTKEQAHWAAVPRPLVPVFSRNEEDLLESLDSIHSSESWSHWNLHRPSKRPWESHPHHFLLRTSSKRRSGCRESPCLRVTLSNPWSRWICCLLNRLRRSHPRRELEEGSSQSSNLSDHSLFQNGSLGAHFQGHRTLYSSKCR